MRGARVLVGVAAAVLAASLHLWAPPATTRLVGGQSRAAPRLDASGTAAGDLAQLVAEHRRATGPAHRPVVLEHAYVTRDWPALQAWPSLSRAAMADLLAQRGPRGNVTGVHLQAATPYFANHVAEQPWVQAFHSQLNTSGGGGGGNGADDEQQAAEALGRLRVVPRHSVVAAPLRDVLLPPPPAAPLLPDRYMYWASALADLGQLAEAGVGDTGPLLLGRRRVSERVWVSSPRVTAAPHYDTYHNALVQMWGEKTVHLWPPECAAHLHLFPSLHPGYRQSQVQDPEACDTALYPDIAGMPPSCTPLRAHLRPGDTLLMPAFWFHLIAAPHGSISLNVWAYDEAAESAEGMLRAPIPFEEEWSADATLVALVGYTHHLIRTLLGTDPVAFCRAWLASRFRPLGPVDRPLGAAAARDKGEAAIHSDVVAASYRRRCQGPGPPGFTAAEMRRGSAKIAEHLMPLAPAIRTLFLQDLVEEMVAFFVGVPDLPVFVHACLAPQAQS